MTDLDKQESQIDHDIIIDVKPITTGEAVSSSGGYDALHNEFKQNGFIMLDWPVIAQSTCAALKQRLYHVAQGEFDTTDGRE